MTENLRIVEYTPDRIDECVEMFHKLYSAPPFAFEWLDREKSSKYLTNLSNIPGSLSYILIEENAVVGVCFGQKEDHFSNPGYKINEFLIEPDHQHEGLDTFFINELENWLRELGVKTMSLFRIS